MDFFGALLMKMGKRGMRQKDAKHFADKGSVLFSGGTDSTLAAYLVGRRVGHLTLLTFDPGYILFVENSRRHVPRLKAALGEDRVEHVILSIAPHIRKLLLGRRKEDLRKYGFNLTALVCLGCRMAMHTAAIIYNLEHRIPLVADGSIRAQSTIPEQLESFIRRNRRQLWERYGLRHYSPIYDEAHSDRRLDEMGLSETKALKRQFILFDTQPSCVFGVPADVYARLFYGGLSGPAREVDAFEYSEERYPMIHRIMEEHFNASSPGLEKLVEEMKATSALFPETLEDKGDA